MADPIKARSKALSFWLRHKPEAAGLCMDQSGWVDVTPILAALAEARLPTDDALLRRVVDENDKQRFELSDDGQQIRARQGHSVKVEGGWRAATPPQVLYHGTVERFWPSIQAQGLLPGGRHHVHLSPDIETARKVGARRGEPFVLTIDSGAMSEAGFAFLLSSNGVWLVDRVPAEYLSRLP